MLELINMIPDELGWALVGAVAMSIIFLGVELLRYGIKCNKEDEENA